MHHDVKSIKCSGCIIHIEESLVKNALYVRYYIQNKNYIDATNSLPLLGLLYKNNSKPLKCMCYDIVMGKCINKVIDYKLKDPTQIWSINTHREKIQWMLENNLALKDGESNLKLYNYQPNYRNLFSDWQPSME